MNIQHSNLSSQLKANTEKEETLINLQEAAYKQEEETTKLNQKIVYILLETTTETKNKAELFAEDRGEYI